jgi:hypothetical protein
MSVYRKNISVMEPSSTAAMMRMKQVVLVMRAILHVQTRPSAFLTTTFVMATVIVREEKMRIKTAHHVKGFYATTGSASHRAGFVMATVIVQKEKMRIKTAHLHHLVSLNAITGPAYLRAGYVTEIEIVRMERMKIRTALLAADLCALMVTVFLKAGYVMAILTVPMMRLTVHAMGSSAITDAAYQNLGFAMEAQTAWTALTKQTAQ